jgi:phosphoenolpyruvate synthase/pyruvate phosphate dikinase
LGGKGANLAEMASIGLSVPPGLTISTEACQEYQLNGKKLEEGLWEEILEGLEMVEKDIGASLGDPSKPLLLSVRSGAAVSFCHMSIVYRVATYLLIYNVFFFWLLNLLIYNVQHLNRLHLSDT